MIPTFDAYNELELVGRGTHTSVYRCIHRPTGARVAVKVFDAGLDSVSVGRRLRRELDALLALRGHPHIIFVEEVVESAGAIGLVMEYAPGGSLADLLRAGPVSPERAVFVAGQVALGLKAAHELGIVHRDVKPQNILLSSFDQVKLCDFGLAAAAESLPTTTSAVSVRYSSPEILNGLPVTSASDIFSLGAVIFRCLAGRPPRLSERADPNETPELQGAPPQLAALVKQCLDHNPQSRPTAAEVAVQLLDRAILTPAIEPISPMRAPSASPALGTNGLAAAATPNPEVQAPKALGEPSRPTVLAAGHETPAMSDARPNDPIDDAPPAPAPAFTRQDPPTLPRGPMPKASNATVAIAFDRPKATEPEPPPRRRFPWVLVAIAVSSGAAAYAVVSLVL